ncbi:MAG: hypothetical protein V1494_04490 [Candidatus Diapherotrites archaeon]
MAYSHKNSRGKTYFLHAGEGRGGSTLYFFSGSSDNGAELPEGYKVIENKKTGLPMVKKK